MFNFYLINEYSELNAPSPFNSSAEVALMFRTIVSGILREGELLKYQVFNSTSTVFDIHQEADRLKEEGGNGRLGLLLLFELISCCFGILLL